MQPSRGNLLVKPVETQESWGPIVLLEETRQRWVGMQAEVVAVGEPELCADYEECPRWMHGQWGLEENAPLIHICEVKKGDWLLCRPRCFVATDVENVWVCKQSDVLAKLVLTP